MGYFYQCIEKNISDFNYLYNFGKDYINNNNSYISNNYNIEQYDNYLSSLDNPTLSSDIRESIKRLISDTQQILFENNIYNSTQANGFIEYHRYLNGNNMPLGIHADDFGAVDYTVNTVIFYLKKTVDGGDLEIYEDDETTLKEIINVTPNENKIKIVIMEGNVCHYVNKIKTEGIRECIVVQLKCLR